MFADLKPYPSYQLSSMSQTSIPMHWTSQPMRTITRPRSMRNRPDLPLLSVARERGVFVRSDEDDNHNVVPDDLTNYKVTLAGDLVINKMKAWQGSLGLAPCDGVVSPSYYVYEFVMANKFYGEVLLRSRPYVTEYGRASDGVRIGQWDLDVARFRSIPVWIPPADEQSAIVKYLAHANGRIDRAILAKRKMIALLEEKEQAIIDHAVTRGLDPTTPTKGSGVPWCTDMPIGWQLRRLKTLLKRIDQGVSPQAESTPATGSEWGVLKAGCVNGGVFKEHQNKRLPPSLDIPRVHRVNVGDVLTSRASGSPHLVGSTGRVRRLGRNLILSDKTFRLVFNRAVDMDFMVYAMNSSRYRYQVRLAISGAEGLANNLPSSELRQFVFPVPPRSEQERIATWIATENAAAEGAKERAAREMELLREFKARLTADVVTGQIDVQEIATKLPDVDPAEAAESVGADVDDELEEEAAEFLESAEP